MSTRTLISGREPESEKDATMRAIIAEYFNRLWPVNHAQNLQRITLYPEAGRCRGSLQTFSGHTLLMWFRSTFHDLAIPISEYEITRAVLRSELPLCHPLSKDEYIESHRLYRSLLDDGGAVEGVTLLRGYGEWRDWIFLELPHPGRLAHLLIVALSLSREAGLYFTLSAPTPHLDDPNATDRLQKLEASSTKGPA